MAAAVRRYRRQELHGEPRRPRLRARPGPRQRGEGRRDPVVRPRPGVDRGQALTPAHRQVDR
ncbi:hypothetical protein CBM2623_B70136 [Cupriavidus taiwanensis]|nr:hypothetical protein CBM2623_B70136 [Cupriavidus taiwanensis]